MNPDLSAPLTHEEFVSLRDCAKGFKAADLARLCNVFAAVINRAALTSSMGTDPRVERVAVRLLVFLNLRLCMRHRDTRYDVDSGQCDSRALVLTK